MKDDMVDKFDKAIRASMKDLEVPYDPASWDLLKQKIAAKSAVEEGVGIDDVASNALTNLTVPYDPKTWKVLSDRLDQIDYRRKLLALKLFEAAVILLAILTAVRFIGNLPSPTTDNQQQIASSDTPEQTTIDQIASGVESDLMVETKDVERINSLLIETWSAFIHSNKIVTISRYV